MKASVMTVAALVRWIYLDLELHDVMGWLLDLAQTGEIAFKLSLKIHCSASFTSGFSLVVINRELNDCKSYKYKFTLTVS